MLIENKNLILKAIFGLLVCGLIGELIYYAYVVKTSMKIVPVDEYVLPSQPPITEKLYIESAVGHKGEIIELNEMTPDSKVPKIEFSFQIEVNNAGKMEYIVLYYSKAELDSLRVMDSSGEFISYNSLAIGQSVEISDDTLEIKILD